MKGIRYEVYKDICTCGVGTSGVLHISCGWNCILSTDHVPHSHSRRRWRNNVYATSNGETEMKKVVDFFKILAITNAVIAVLLIVGLGAGYLAAMILVNYGLFAYIVICSFVISILIAIIIIIERDVDKN